MERIRKFFNSYIFMIISFLFTIICWYLKNQNIAVIYYIICIAIIILTNANKTTISTIAFCAIINYRETTFSSNSKIALLSTICLLPLFIYEVFKNKPKYKDAIFLSLLAILITSGLSLFNTFEENINDALIGIFKLFVYVFIFYFCLINKKEEDYSYVSKSIVALGIAIIVELAIYAITYSGGSLWNKDISIGWGISNSVSMLLLITIPITIYVYIENPKHIYLIVFIILEMLSILLMLCKGALLALIILVIPFAILLYFMIYGKRMRKIYLITMAIIFVGFVISIIYVYTNKEIMEGIKKYFDGVVDRGGLFRDESRMVIYETGFNIFKKYPLFGSGINTAVYYLELNGFDANLKHYHNFVIQVLATTGTFGFLSMVSFGFFALRKCFTKNCYNICCGFAFLALIIHGLVDNTFHNPIVMIVLLFMLSSLVSKDTLVPLDRLEIKTSEK